MWVHRDVNEVEHDRQLHPCGLRFSRCVSNSLKKHVPPALRQDAIRRARRIDHAGAEVILRLLTVRRDAAETRAFLGFATSSFPPHVGCQG
jgi:hypothetical protein